MLKSGNQIETLNASALRTGLPSLEQSKPDALHEENSPISKAAYFSSELAECERIPFLQLCRELSNELFENARTSFNGANFAVHVSPSFDNFGAVAQVRVIGKGAPRAHGKGLQKGAARAFVDEETFRTEVLARLVQQGRCGSSPQINPIFLDLGDEHFSGIMTLYIGIRKRAL